MSLRRRIQLLFLAFALIALTQFAADRIVAAEQAATRELIDSRLQPARDELSAVLTALIDQETGQRGFVITGEEQFLEPYREGQVVVDNGLARLRRLLAGEPALLAGIDRVENRISAWRQLGAELEIEAKRTGRDEDAMDLVATGPGKELFDRARAEIARVQVDLVDELTAEQARVARLDAALEVVSGLGALATLVLVAIGAVLLQSWSIRPLASLATALRRLSAGRLQTTVKGEGPPELAQLGDDVEGLRQRMLAEIDDATRSREALAKRGLVVLTLRDELAPRQACLPPGVSVAARMEPAEGVLAGDWYDVVPLPGGRLALILVDVSGHATETGVFAVKTKHLALAALDGARSPGEALGWLAEQLGDTGDEFLTGVVVELDSATGRLRYASAGHPPVLVVGGGEVLALEPTGPLLGPLPATWQTGTTALRGGEIVALYSDGVTEAEDGAGAEYGTARLAAALQQQGDGVALDERAERVLSDLRAFHPDRARDDVTLLLVAWDAPASAS